MSPIISLCEARGLDYYMIHTGQHYSDNMDEVFFEQLRLPNPKYSLGVGSSSHGLQTGRMIEKIEEILASDLCAVVLVQGDTNTVLAGSIAVLKMDVKLGHVETGLRSYDMTIPEEINRRVSDHVSDYLLAPTLASRVYLIGEGIADAQIYVMGNTVVDTLYRNIEFSSDIGKKRLEALGLRVKEYFLVTAHRAENVDNPARFSKILRSLDLLGEKYGLDVVYSIHPRSLLILGLPDLFFSFFDVAAIVYLINMFNNTHYFSVPVTLIALGMIILGVLLVNRSLMLHSISKIKVSSQKRIGDAILL